MQEGSALFVQFARSQILHQFGGPVGLNAGCSPIDGILPDRRLISGSQAVDVDVNVRLLRDCDHIIFEVTRVESDHAEIKLASSFSSVVALSASGMTFRDGRSASTPFKKPAPP